MVFISKSYFKRLFQMDVSNYIRQHNEAASVVSEIEALVSGNAVVDSAKVASLINTLVGKLKIHLSMEDKSIYPRAKESSNGDLRAMAIKLENEMSGLAGSLIEFSQKWRLANAIEDDMASFISESRVVFSALKKRIEVEERDFYPLVAEHA